MKKWKIFYVDGTMFSNADGKPEDAPGGGVAIIATEDDTVGLLIHHRNDYYAFDEQYGGWFGLDEKGFTQFICRPGLKILKLGESMDTGRFKALFTRIHADPELPNKSARYPWEDAL